MARTLALIAHDGKKDDLVRFVQEHQEELAEFELVATGATAYRLDVEVHLLPTDGDPDTVPGTLIWKMRKALPTKFKAADLNAKATEVGVEELQFVHEGLSLDLQAGGSS